VKMSAQFDDPSLDIFQKASEDDKMFPPGANSVYVVDTADSSGKKPQCAFENISWDEGHAFAPGLRMNNCPAINVGWDTCPDACFVKPGCPNADKVQYKSGFKGNAWYCVDDNGTPLDLDGPDDEWDPCCIHSACDAGLESKWNQEGVWGTFHKKDDPVRGTWTCSDEGTQLMQSSTANFCDSLIHASNVWWFSNGQSFDAGHFSCATVPGNYEFVALTTKAGDDKTKYFEFRNNDWSHPGAVMLSGSGKDYWYVTEDGDGNIKLWCASGTPTNPQLSTSEMTDKVHGVLFPSEPGSACDGYDSLPH